MNFLLTFDGTLFVGFEPHEIDEQIEFLLNVEPSTEEESEQLQKILLEIIANKKHERPS